MNTICALISENTEVTISYNGENSQFFDLFKFDQLFSLFRKKGADKNNVYLKEEKAEIVKTNRKSRLSMTKK